MNGPDSKLGTPVPARRALFLLLAAALPASATAAAIFLAMPSALGADLSSSYSRLASIGLASIVVWAVLGLSVLAVTTWVVIAVTAFESVGAVIRSALCIAGVSALSLFLVGMSMDIAIHNVNPASVPAPGSTAVVALASAGVGALLVAAIAQLVSRLRTRRSRA